MGKGDPQKHAKRQSTSCNALPRLLHIGGAHFCYHEGNQTWKVEAHGSSARFEDNGRTNNKNTLCKRNLKITKIICSKQKY